MELNEISKFIESFMLRSPAPTEHRRISLRRWFSSKAMKKRKKEKRNFPHFIFQVDGERHLKRIKAAFFFPSFLQSSSGGCDKYLMKIFPTHMHDHIHSLWRRVFLGKTDQKSSKKMRKRWKKFVLSRNTSANESASRSHVSPDYFISFKDEN